MRRLIIVWTPQYPRRRRWRSRNDGQKRNEEGGTWDVKRMTDFRIFIGEAGKGTANKMFVNQIADAMD